MTEGGPDGPPYYGRARIIAATGLVALVIALALIDAFSERYQVDSIQLGLLLGTALVLLGIEAGSRLIGKP